MTFGYYDTSKFTGKINWHKAVYRKMFGIELDDIIINGKKMNFCGEKGIYQKCLITVDSGTSYLSVPSQAFNEIIKIAPAANIGKDCKTQKDFGEITWVIGGVNYTLEADEWIYPPSGINGLSPDKYF